MNIEHQTLRLSRLVMHAAAAGTRTPVLLQRVRRRCGRGRRSVKTGGSGPARR